MKDIHSHVERYIGPIDAILYDGSIQLPNINIFIVKATAEKPWHTLITAGMSELAMPLPTEMLQYSHASPFVELMVSLPPQWILPKLYEVAAANNQPHEWYWPIGVLLYLAKFPHLSHTWLTAEHIIPNGRPAECYAANTRLCGSLLFPSLLTPREFHELQIDEHKKIVFLALSPVYQEEMNLVEEQGIDALFQRLSQHQINDYIIPDRVNTALPTNL